MNILSEEVVENSLGIKTECNACGKRFYSLGKKEVVCPYCENKFVIEPILKSRISDIENKNDKDDMEDDIDENEFTNLENADNEKRNVKSKKHASLDEDDDIDIDLDDDIDDNIDDVSLINDDDDDDVSEIIGSKDKSDDVSNS